MLEKGESGHCHQGMAVQAFPGSSFEVFQSKFLLQLLVCLFTDPAVLDGGCQGLQFRGFGQVRQIIFMFARCPTFANQPDLLAGQVLLTHQADSLGRPVKVPARSIPCERER